MTEEKPGGGRGHFLGSQPLSFWQLSRQLGAKRINRRESRSSDISNVEQQFGMTHTLPAPVRPLRNFFMKEWHLHHTIWTRLSLSPHNMEAEIWNEKISFQQEHPHFTRNAPKCEHFRSNMFRSLSKWGRLEVRVEFILSPQSRCILSLSPFHNLQKWIAMRASRINPQ